MPLISIITITYNAQEFLERTIASVRKQSVTDFEYILIDGGSNDGTLAIVDANKDIFDIVVSEKDNGLYDAMNKGLSKATGRYVWFMNAGDEIAEINAIETISKLALTMPDVIYSDTVFVDNTGKKLGLRSEILPHKVPDILTWPQFNKGMLICHQSFIVRRDLAPFYILNNLSADIDWEIKCLKNSKSNISYPGILSKYLIGGLSNQQQLKSWKDRFMVLQSHFGFLPNIFNHLKIIIRAIFTKF
jgi:glycosyltransferase involved in cell wall biosynthesis